MKKKYVIAIQFYFEDNWYGTRARYIYNGIDGEGFDTKGAASKHASMLRKFVKEEHRVSEKGFFEIDEFENLETYKYMGAGPSWACSNVMVDAEKFTHFVEKENEKMGERRRDREFNEKHRQTRKERFESMRRGKANRTR